VELDATGGQGDERPGARAAIEGRNRFRRPRPGPVRGDGRLVDRRALRRGLWVTHFLNASYYGVPRESRDLAHLRLAWAVLTTYWHELGGGQLGARQVRRFHHSFRSAGSPDGSSYPRGLLDRDQLEGGAVHLLGDWFGDAQADPARIGWGGFSRHPRRERSTGRRCV
jgi:hypothetical protein